MNGSDRVVWIGCDCGEQFHVLSVLDPRGQPRESRRVNNGWEELESFLVSVGESVEGGSLLQVVVEMQRSGGARVVQVARKLGLEVWTVCPGALHAFRRSEGQPRKDDAWDAYLLGRMGYLGSKGCRPALESTPEQRRLCRLTRLHHQLCQQKVRALLRLRERLMELAPELVSSSSSTPRWQSVRMRRFLSRHPALDGVDEVPVDQVALLLAGVPERQRLREAEALRLVAVGIRLDPAEREVVAFEIQLILAEITRLHESLLQLDAEIRRRVEEHPVGVRLLQVPGIGAWVAGVLIGELLSLARAIPEPKLATYAGVTPLNRSSGQMTGTRRLARATNKHALRALYLSSVSAVRHSSLDRAYYQRQRTRHQGHPKPHTAALIALSRQRLKMIYKLLTTDQAYDKEILIRSHLRRRAEVPA